ncbi:hypothetical protein MAH2_20710 [Sessilibacter sp. MAH2]
MSLVKQYINDGKSFIVESTISGITYLKYAKQAKADGFRTTFIYVSLAGAQLSEERVSKRRRLGGMQYRPITLRGITLVHWSI